MRARTILMFVVGALAVGLSTNAFAQDKRGNFILGGGYTAPNSEVRDHLGDGYNFVIGGQYNATPVISIEGLYSFNGLGDKQISIPVSGTPGGAGIPTDFFADMNMQYGTVSVLFQKPEGSFKPYGLVGMGVYYRPIKVTTPGVGFVPGYCDPCWYVCYPVDLSPSRTLSASAAQPTLAWPSVAARGSASATPNCVITTSGVRRSKSGRRRCHRFHR